MIVIVSDCRHSVVLVDCFHCSRFLDILPVAVPRPSGPPERVSVVLPTSMWSLPICVTRRRALRTVEQQRILRYASSTVMAMVTQTLQVLRASTPSFRVFCDCSKRQTKPKAKTYQPTRGIIASESVPVCTRLGTEKL